jgi:hypothetical protein
MPPYGTDQRLYLIFNNELYIPKYSKKCETYIFSLCLCRKSCVKNLSGFSGGRKNHLLTKHVSSETKRVIPKYVIFSSISKYAQNCYTWLNAHTKHDCQRIFKKMNFINHKAPVQQIASACRSGGFEGFSDVHRHMQCV